VSEIEAEFLQDGAQSAEDVADRLAGFISEARWTIDVAIYDFHAREGPSARAADALEAAAARGVHVRVVFNQEREAAVSHNPPMLCDPDTIDGLEVPTRGVHDEGALMHHKYVVRDDRHVWTGSVNWTEDAFAREENAIVRVDSTEIAAAYTRNFEQLWDRERIEPSGGEGTRVDLGGGTSVQPLFSPHGPSLAHRVAERIAAADHRVRVLSPVLTSGAILGTLAEIAGRESFDLRGAYDATQMREVAQQWEAWPPNHWKLAAWEAIRPRLAGKPSTPWSTHGSVHDYMHAKVAVADEEVLTGSYNLSRGGEDNAENLLHIRSGPIAERFAEFAERVADRYTQAQGEDLRD
jgi:phosphatidylserine/phosphatidylglycerophosphate/cardiolipin synthase-like enzyme